MATARSSSRKKPQNTTRRSTARRSTARPPAARPPAAPAPAPTTSMQTTQAPSPPATTERPRDAELDRPAPSRGLSRGQKIGGLVLATAVAGLAVAAFMPRKANASTLPRGSGTNSPVVASPRPRANAATTAPSTVLSDGQPPPDHDSQLDSLDDTGATPGARITLHASERGLTRTQVLHYQQELFDLGAPVDAVDGILGEKTRNGVRRFQEAWNADPANASRRLTVDGILGPSTRAAIDTAHTLHRDGTPATSGTPGAVAISEDTIDVVGSR